jgi:hypothetical protein
MNGNSYNRLNPCKLKGRLGGRRTSGRVYRYPDSEEVSLSSCECSGRWVLMSERFHKRRAVTMRFHRDRIELVQLSDEGPKDQRDLIVAPCEEKFRHAGSPGTRFYRKFSTYKLGVLPEFSGCQSLEEGLVEDGLVNHDRVPGLLKKPDAILKIESKVSFSSLSGTTIEHGEFGPPHELDSRSVELEPWLYDSEILDDLRTKRQEDIQMRIDDFKAELTDPQLEAINLVYLKNTGSWSQGDVAQRLGISIGSLRDRLTQAFIKLEKSFPEFSRKRRVRKRADSD